jgi:hypothetical protein
MKNTIAGYDDAAYEQYVRECFDEFQPQGPTEEQLVQMLADSAWRQRFIVPAEIDILTPAATDMATLKKQIRALNVLELHSRRLRRQYDSTFKLLRKIQAQRRAESPKPASIKRVRKPSFTTDGMTIQ